MMWCITGTMLAGPILQIMGAPGLLETNDQMRWTQDFDQNLAGAMYAEKRNQRTHGSVLGYN